VTIPEFKQLVDEIKKEINEIDQNELKRRQQASRDFALIIQLNFT